MSEITDLLRQVPLLRGLTQADLERLGGATRRVSFGAGEEIVSIGAPGNSLFIVLAGSVRMIHPGRGTEFELARLGAGDFFGEMALLNDKPRSATVRAGEPVEALLLHKDAFRAVVLEAPALALQLMEAMSERIRTADEHISDLSEQAMKDPLTGLLNRRAFHERTLQEMGRVRRYGASVSLVLVDLDDFQVINDTLGHDTGDTVLRWVGRILTEHTRTADSAFRVGGKTFAVLCPDTRPPEAHVAAVRLVEVVGQARPPLDGLRVTMSAGYATCPHHAADFDALFSASEAALGRAKVEGRNRVGDPLTSTPEQASRRP